MTGHPPVVERLWDAMRTVAGILNPAESEAVSLDLAASSIWGGLFAATSRDGAPALFSARDTIRGCSFDSSRPEDLGGLGYRYDIGRPGDPYLTRWDILDNRFTSQPHLFLHLFHRGDYEGALHDHPWPFWSLILAGGYYEVTEQGATWYGPLSFLRRPADWKHRVALKDGQRALTLVWTGPKERSWGFHCPSGFTHWRAFAAREERGEEGCQ